MSKLYSYHMDLSVGVLVHTTVECWCLKERNDETRCTRLRTVSTASTSYTAKTVNNESSPQKSAGSSLLLSMLTLLEHAVCISTCHSRSPVVVAVVAAAVLVLVLVVAVVVLVAAAAAAAVAAVVVVVDFVVVAVVFVLLLLSLMLLLLLLMLLTPSLSHHDVPARCDGCACGWAWIWRRG